MSEATYEDKFLAVWDSLDHVKIREAIEQPGVSLYDAEEAREVVFAAAYRWLLEDLEQLTVDSVEQELVTPDTNFKFVLDMAGTFTGKGTKIIQYDDRKYSPAALTKFRGAKYNLDWKTTKKNLDARWQDSYEGSWQWRDYLAETGAEYFVYRGIKRRSKPEDEVETREFCIHRSVQPDLVEVHKINLTGTEAMRDALIDRNEVPWPQYRPSGCKAFGRACPYTDDCAAGLQFIPLGNLTKGRALSYSRKEEFALCPERHRRSVLDKLALAEEGNSGPEAEFGKAFHRGIAELYRQAFDPKEKEGT